ncbi:MAG: guanylate kinase [Armatimonadetes bacterium]|nr:guanylate kinase [Armatimonadota bacterium]
MAFDLCQYENRRGRLIVLSGPSGVGKDTLLRRLVEVCPGIERCVTFTTRDPRPGEVAGVDYNFVSEDEFRRMIEADDFLEHAQVHLDLYGSPKSPCDAIRERGSDALLKIDVQGGLQVKRKAPDAIMIFVVPPSFEELERRLRARYTDSEESIRKRLQDARSEIAQIPHYDYLVVNDEVEPASDRLQSIVVAERLRIRQT